jgi:glycosyltransferase involved in cell wall biosynthesis
MNTLKRVVQRADAVLTISAHARDDMVRTLHVASDRIVITPLATKLSIQAPVLTKRPYFLALGAMDPRKNLIGALHALKAANQKEFRLKIVGLEPQFLPKSRELLNSLGIQDQVDLSPMVSDEELTELYQNAAGFLYLSLYEGFGLPLLEAMALGCPVISSNRAALPEVGGDGVILVDPFDASATADAMQKLIADVAFRNDLIRRGQSRVASFGWKQTAELTHDCYLRVIRHRGLGGEVQ